MLGMQKRRDDKLREACRTGDAEAVRALLKKGANPDTGDGYHENVLIRAIDSGNAEIVRLLLDAGASVRNDSDEYRQPIVHAARKKDTEIFAMLVEHGADCTVGGWGRKTPLHEAAWYDATEIVTMLLDPEKCPGVDINALDSEGNTPLMRALGDRKKTAAASLILEHKPELDHRSQKDGRTALLMAINTGCTDLALKMIWLGADASLAEDCGMTPLMSASLAGYDAVVDAILEETGGADIDLKNASGRTALHIAAGRGQKKVVERLIAAGADVNIADADGATALMAAVESGKTGSVKLLIDAGASVDAADKKGDTALIAACNRYNAIKLVETLLKAGADPNIANDKGVTPLVQAASHDYEDVGKLLLDNGADPDAVTGYSDAFFSAKYVDTYERWKREYKQNQKTRSKSGFIVEDENTVVKKQELLGGELILTRIFNFKSAELITVTNDKGHRSTDVKNFSEVENRAEIDAAWQALHPEATDKTVAKKKAAVDIRLK